MENPIAKFGHNFISVIILVKVHNFIAVFIYCLLEKLIFSSSFFGALSLYQKLTWIGWAKCKFAICTLHFAQPPQLKRSN